MQLDKFGGAAIVAITLALSAQRVAAQSAADSANAAVAKVIASDWVDYLELAKWNGRWVIVNVLWESKPRTP